MSLRKEISQSQQSLREHDLWRQRITVDSPQGVHVQVDGKPFINFSSNDYLGLANHPEVRAAAAAAAEKWGVGSGASHLISGHQRPHADLEERLAQFVGAEQAILFSTGYMANLAVPQALLGREDLLLQDKLNHASLIDAAKLCSAKLRRYRHGDVTHASEIMDKNSGRRILLATDGVFSMNGKIAPLINLEKVAQPHGAIMLVDDAHGFGVAGTGGAGTLHSTPLRPAGNILMIGTLSKAIGAFGAFVAGDKVFIEQLIQKSRSYIYTTALPCSIAAAALKSLDLIESDRSRHDRLINNMNCFRKTVKALDIDVVHSVTPIQSMIFGQPTAALQAAEILREQGILAIAIRPPTVPAGTSRLRITLSADHTTEEVERLLDILASTEIRELSAANVGADNVGEAGDNVESE
jgi:8-amino-7-oxononanoate synthase